MLKVSIYGAGYVGLVTSVCLAKLGHDVCCYDIDAEKINNLQNVVLSIYEENLATLLADVVALKKIHFTDDFDHVAQYGFVHIIAVGTPPQSDGSADLSHVRDVTIKLSKILNSYRVIVNKSTVPVGTTDQVQQLMGNQFDVVSNPEFLKEGKAIHDFLQPDRIIIGSNSARAIQVMRELYAPLLNQGVPLLVMSPRSSELTKYAANAFLATKISFINEMSQLAERLGADIDQVQQGMGYDHRIGRHFLNPGCGYGGSCFPKDVAALEILAKQFDYQPYILEAVQKRNEQQKCVLFEKIRRYFNDDLAGRCIALWGLAFKPGTDDIRCAPSLRLIELLWQAGAIVQAYDPMAMPHVRKYYGNHEALILCDSPEAALNNAHALAIVTEWPQFLDPDFKKIKAALHQPIIFDGRNIYDPQVVAKQGLQYCAMGRGLPFLRVPA